MAEQKQYEKIGAMFRRSREAMPADVEQVAQALFIRARYLRAIEAGRFQELPGPAYVKGYLTAYAQFLHMDEHEVLRQFHAIEPDLRRNLFFPFVFSREKDVKPWMITGGLIAAICVAVLWVGAVQVPPSPVQPIDAWRSELLKKGHISAFSAHNDACFRQQGRLYPPCYARGQVLDLLPLERQMRSVMDLKY